MGAARGFGAVLGAFILYAHYAFPNTDPAPNVWEWIITESPKRALGVLLLLPWSRIRYYPSWLVLFSGLIFCTAVFLVRIVRGVVLQFTLSLTMARIAVPLVSASLIGCLLIFQIVAIWKIQEMSKPR
jgi:hypothetical protein